jgi:hypothetical protein
MSHQYITENESPIYNRKLDDESPIYDLIVWILKLTLLYLINYPWPWPVTVISVGRIYNLWRRRQQTQKMSHQSYWIYNRKWVTGTNISNWHGAKDLSGASPTRDSEAFRSSTFSEACPIGATLSDAQHIREFDIFGELLVHQRL